jgi:hypothetical protein
MMRRVRLLVLVCAAAAAAREDYAVVLSLSDTCPTACAVVTAVSRPLAVAAVGSWHGGADGSVTIPAPLASVPEDGVAPRSHAAKVSPAVAPSAVSPGPAGTRSTAAATPAAAAPGTSEAVAAAAGKKNPTQPFARMVRTYAMPSSWPLTRLPAFPCVHVASQCSCLIEWPPL